MVWFNARYSKPENGMTVLLRQRNKVFKALYDEASGSFLVRKDGRVVPAQEAEWTLYVPLFMRLLFF